MQSSKTFASFDTQKRKVYDEDLTARGRLGIFLDSENIHHNFRKLVEAPIRYWKLLGLKRIFVVKGRKEREVGTAPFRKVEGS